MQHRKHLFFLRQLKWRFLVCLISFITVFRLRQISRVETKVKTGTKKSNDCNDIDRGGVEKKKKTSTERTDNDGGTLIKQISVIGERNSGTTWTTSHLRDCFNYTIPVKSDLVRHKHWFQQDVLKSARVYDTLVVAQFRNSYHWVDAMRRKNYLAPMHYKKDWETFVTTPWTMPNRLDYDIALLKSHQKENNGIANTSAIACQSNFTYNQINSCLKRPYLEGEKFRKRKEKRSRKRKEAGKESDGMSYLEPFYELRNDGSGRPYSTIIEMRSDKIRNFLSIADWDWIAGVVPVRYEDLVVHGTKNMIDHIEKVTGIEAKCKSYPPQDRPPRDLEPELVDWISKHADWDTEGLIGYLDRNSGDI